MPTTDDTLRSGEDSSRISSGRDRASAARSWPLPPGLPAQHTPRKKAAAEADHTGFFGLSASARCRRARRTFATIAGGASKPTARRPLPIGIRGQSASARRSASARSGGRGAARPRQGPRRQRPRKQKTRGPPKEWPRVFACIVWRRFPKKPRPRVGGTGFEPVTSTV